MGYRRGGLAESSIQSTLKHLVMSPLPARGKKGKEGIKNRCLLLCMSVLRQDEQLHERMRTAILQPRLQRRRLQVGLVSPGRRITEARHQPPYHRGPTGCGCILAGDTEGGGLDMMPPVAGLMMGMGLRARVADGW